MMKTIKVSLNLFETYIEGITFPDRFDADICKYKFPNSAEDVYLMTNVHNESVFNLFPFITLRNKFDLFDRNKYFGEVRLNYVKMDAVGPKLITVVHCRIGD